MWSCLLLWIFYFSPCDIILGFNKFWYKFIWYLALSFLLIFDSLSLSIFRLIITFLNYFSFIYLFLKGTLNSLLIILLFILKWLDFIFYLFFSLFQNWFFFIFLFICTIFFYIFLLILILFIYFIFVFLYILFDNNIFIGSGYYYN